MENTDVSRLLGEMWRNEHPSKRAPYVEQEKRERAVYKNMSAEWRVKQSRLDATSRTTQHQIHQKMVEHPQQAFDRNHRDGGGKYVENDRNQQNIENLHGAHNCRNHTPNMDYLASSDRHPPAPATGKKPFCPSCIAYFGKKNIFLIYFSSFTVSRIRTVPSHRKRDGALPAL